MKSQALMTVTETFGYASWTSGMISRAHDFRGLVSAVSSFSPSLHEYLSAPYLGSCSCAFVQRTCHFIQLYSSLLLELLIKLLSESA